MHQNDVATYRALRMPHGIPNPLGYVIFYAFTIIPHSMAPTFYNFLISNFIFSAQIMLDIKVVFGEMYCLFLIVFISVVCLYAPHTSGVRLTATFGRD